MQDGYFGCIGCGRMFKFTDHEMAEYGLHDCNAPEERLIVPVYTTFWQRVSSILWKR